jgi:hypothetical protein
VISITSRRSGKFKNFGRLVGLVGFLRFLEQGRVDSVEIERAGCASAGAFHDVEINHGGFDAGVPQERLDAADVGAGFEEMGRPASLRFAGASSDFTGAGFT